MKKRTTDKRRNRRRSDRRSAVRILAVIVIGMFMLVGMRSYAAIIQHENNQLVKENEYLQAEIDSLQSQIIDETKITRIENIATGKYGMVYPSAENVVKISTGETQEQNLAQAIRSEAYN